MKYVVLCTEHDESYSNAPMVCGKFDSLDRAKAYINGAVRKTLTEFPDETEDGFGVVRSFDEDGFPTYGCVWSIVEVEDSKKEKKDVNKYGVPYERVSLLLEDGTQVLADLGDKDDWCDIQECMPGDCEDWENSIGWGNDVKGHRKIIDVYSVDKECSWTGTDAIRSWFETKVAVWAKNYSA